MMNLEQFIFVTYKLKLQKAAAEQHYCTHQTDEDNNGIQIRKSIGQPTWILRIEMTFYGKNRRN